MNTFGSGTFLENIEWFDETGTELVHRLPETGSGEIKFGAQLTVRESQAAVLFYQGKACDVFGPGRVTLKTLNLPILTRILSFPWKGDSPLRAEIYMVNMKYFTGLKWGTSQPVAFRDNELGLIRLRAHGVYNLQIAQPVLFINSMIGTMASFSAESINEYLKKVIVSRFNDYLGLHLDTIFNLPGKFDTLSHDLQQQLANDFNQFGLRLSNMYITSITPPDEVQKAIDDRSRMSTIPDMNKFMQMKAALAMEKAAEAHGETGAGLSMGLGMMIPAMFQQAGRAAIPQASPSEEIRCEICKAPVPVDARFCPRCGHQQIACQQCQSCGRNLAPDAQFCPKCGQKVVVGKVDQIKVCPVCKGSNLMGSLYCNQCGEKL